MKKRILLLLTLLLMCVLIPLQEASSQLAIPTELSVVGDSSKTTTTTDTEDITFTVDVKRLKAGFVYVATISVSSSPALTASPDTANIFGIALNASQEVTVTVTRAAITTAGAGTYTITFTVDESFVANLAGIDPISIDLTLTVEESVTQTYGVTVDVQGSATQTTTTAGTADIEYTIRVTNTGSGSDSFTLSHSGVTDAELSETSLSSIAASAYEDVTLTVPRSALADVDTYNVTVTATSDGDSNETDDTETETIVNEPTVYGLTLLNVSDLTQTTQNTDTDDITYTLRVTNIGNTQDTIDLTKEGSTDQVTLSQDSLALATDTAADVTVTLPRSALDVVGTYRLLVTATSQGDSSKQAALTMITTVTDGSIPDLRYDTIEIEVLEGLRQTSKTTDTEDVTYTLRITNISVFDFHEVNFTVSGDIGAATITPASVELFASDAVIEIVGYGSKVEDVTLTIPRNVLSRGGNYITTVTVVPYIGLTKTVTVRTIVNPSGTLALEGVGSLTQTTSMTDTDDITYTLRVTNTGDTEDQIQLAVSGDVDTATLDPTSVVLEAGTYDDVTLTIPRAALSDAGTYSVTVTATSENDSTVIAIVTTQTIITDDLTASTELTEQTETTETTKTTKTTETTEQTLFDKSTHKVVFSEFMFESVGGENGLPQWIEVYNNSTKAINLNGWKLHWKRLSPIPFEVTTTFKEDFIIPVAQSRLIVTSLGRHSGGGKLLDDDVYQLHILHAEELTREDINLRNRLIDRGGFSLKLTNANDVLVDNISTLTGDKQTWQLHECLIDGVRTSLIRRFDESVPRTGTERRGWRRAFDAKRLVAGIYYGHSQDLGTPAYRRGKPLPVELSQFSARFVKDEVVINWTTESELNNAGFNVLRSTSRTKNFRPINTKLIKGAGTTGERNTYQFIDKTAKPNLAYYYRIEDIDFSGIREVLTTYQLRGVIAPTGKLITTWSTLKGDR